MAKPILLSINGQSVSVPPATTVAAALANQSIPARRSVTGEARTSLCGMGVCHECRVTIDGRPHQRACETVVQDGMEVRTDA